MMKFTFKLLKSLLFTLIALLLFSVQTKAQNYEKNYQDCKLYVKFVDSYSPEIPVKDDNTVNLSDAEYFSGIISKYDVKYLKKTPVYKNDPRLLRIFEMEIADHSQLDEAIAELEEMPEIEYAVKVALYHVDFHPNDSLYNLVTGLNNWNWHLDKIHAEEAWDITHGDPDIKVAIVDNAIWSEHPDLHNKIVLQRDVANNTNSSDPPNTGNASDWSHGTHCSGLATAITNNEIGVAGIGYNTSIIAVKASYDYDPEHIHKAFDGMVWAMNNGADVISMSYGGSGYDPVTQDYINSGHNNGIVFVAAAGNENVTTPHYPSNYDHVISVAALDENDSKASFSNYNTGVDVSAPGGSGTSGPSGLLSTTFDHTSMGYYDSFQGTSMACPMVAGLCSLILSINPDLTPDQVEEILKNTCDNIDEQNPDYNGMLGAGRINAYQAVLAVPYEPEPEFEADIPIIMPGTSIDFTDMTMGVPETWSWTFEGGTPPSSTEQNPTVNYATEGTFSVTLEVTNEFGTTSITKEDYITVTNTPAPYIDFEVSATETCIKEPVYFSDLSLYNPTSWEWSFEPGTYEFVDGTTANSQNPVVEFLEPGNYTVILDAENGNGSASQTFEDLLNVKGINLTEYNEDFEAGQTDGFGLSANDNAAIMIDSRAANESNFGLHFTGVSNLQGWSGGPTNTTPEQAWEDNVAFHSSASICNVNATQLAGVYLLLDLRQTYSLGNTLSWFRVLVNETIQVPDMEGNLNFNPETNSDPFVMHRFNLGNFAGTYFSLKLQASCRLYDHFFAEGDNVFVDNIQLIGSLVGVDEPVEVPYDIVSVFPNPASDMVTVEFFTNTESEVTVSVTSMSGQLVRESKASAELGTTMIPLDISGLTKGIYVVNVKSVNGVATQKIVVE